jgi:hypothetical protein
MRIDKRQAVLAWMLGCCVGHAAAIDCADLRSNVEASIRSRGVTDFSVTIVASDAPAAGQIVGTCERGAKKLVYARPAAPAGRPAKGVITECADGRVIGQGECRK